MASGSLPEGKRMGGGRGLHPGSVYGLPNGASARSQHMTTSFQKSSLDRSLEAELECDPGPQDGSTGRSAHTSRPDPSGGSAQQTGPWSQAAAGDQGQAGGLLAAAEGC